MLTGERPFTGSSIPQQHLNRPVPSLQALNSSLPEGVDFVIQRAMSKTMQSRFETPSEFLKNLAALTGQTAVTAFTPWSLERLEQPPVNNQEVMPALTRTPVKGRASGGRFQWFPRRIMSFAALCLAVVAITFFSIDNAPALAAAAIPLVEQVSEIISVGDFDNNDNSNVEGDNGNTTPISDRCRE